MNKYLSEVDRLKENFNKTINSKHIDNEELLKIKKKCKKYISSSNRNLDEIINTFNGLISGIGKLIEKELPCNRDISFANSQFPLIIKINYVEPISMFIKHVYIHKEYRESLKTGDDSYFLGTDTSILNKHKDIIPQNEDNVKKFFEFKQYWNKMTDITKEKIKEVMMVIISLVEKYIEIKDDTNDVVFILMNIETKYETN